MVVDDADVAPIYGGVNLNLVYPHITGLVDNASDITDELTVSRLTQLGRSNRRPKRPEV